MLPFQPESTASICARVSKVLTRRFDADQATNGKIKRPGEMREHVFDFEDRIRCVVSLDYIGNDRPLLHISCSSDFNIELTFAGFMARAQNMHALLFPDTALVLKHPITTGKAIHLFYDVPDTMLAPTA